MKKVLHFLFNIDHFLIAIISLLFTAFLFFFFSFNVSFLNPVRRAFADFSMSDVYYSILWQNEKPEKSNLITLINIDTLYQRKDIANVIQQIDNLGPKVMGLDIVFEGRKPDVEGDSILTDVLQRKMENKVIACKLLNYNFETDNFNNSLHSFFIEDLPFIQEGYTNALYSEAGTTLRKFTNYMKLNESPVNSFPMQIFYNYYGDYGVVDTTQLNERFINFSKVNFPVIHFDSIAQYPELIKDRIVLVGTTQKDEDMHYTPIGKISGLKVLAYSIQSLFDNYNIRIMDNGSIWLLAFLASYITQLLQFFITQGLGKFKQASTDFLKNSVVFIRLITFFWLGVIAFIAFVIYVIQGVFISTTAILVAAVLTSEARGVYSSFIKYYVKDTTNIPLLKNSIYIITKKS